MAMPGRTYASTIGGYRYAHNGQEKDGEIFDGALSAEFWEYDSRLGRRWENDPVINDSESPYACFANNPIAMSDPDGLWPDWLTKCFKPKQKSIFRKIKDKIHNRLKPINAKIDRWKRNHKIHLPKIRFPKIHLHLPKIEINWKNINTDMPPLDIHMFGNRKFNSGLFWGSSFLFTIPMPVKIHILTRGINMIKWDHYAKVDRSWGFTLFSGLGPQWFNSDFSRGQGRAALKVHSPFALLITRVDGGNILTYLRTPSQWFNRTIDLKSGITQWEYSLRRKPIEFHILRKHSIRMRVPRITIK